MAECADLEIGVHRYDPTSYTLEFRYCQPNSDAETRVDRGSSDEPILAHFDLEALLKLTPDPDAYGRTLSKGLFSNPQATMAFAKAQSNAQSLGAPLRVRLLIGPSAPELHALHWESLMDQLFKPRTMGWHCEMVTPSKQYHYDGENATSGYAFLTVTLFVRFLFVISISEG